MLPVMHACMHARKTFFGKLDSLEFLHDYNFMLMPNQTRNVAEKSSFSGTGYTICSCSFSHLPMYIFLKCHDLCTRI
jgi:hypothetical protein